jgi:DNA repair photolyase
MDEDYEPDPGDTRDPRQATAPIKGRGSASRPAGRFEKSVRVGEDDGWGSVYEADEAPAPLATVVTEELARSIVSQNLSPGLDFETRLFAKVNAVERLREQLAKPSHHPSPIALGINTDGYQPIEKRYTLTRQLLEVLSETGHPAHIVTKGALILRDLDLLAPMAARGLVHVHLSVTSLDNRLSAKLEPRAAAPHARLRTIAALHEAGVPVGVLVAPVIPMITDQDLERILEAAREAGAASAGYVLLRLPNELKQVWREWLELHYPERAAHVMSLMQQMHGGKDYDSSFGTRMRGQGPFAELIRQRFRKARQRLGYGELPALDESQFVPPRKPSPQGQLF